MRRNPLRARDAMRRWRARHREVDRRAKRDQYRLDPRPVIKRNKAYARAHPEVRLAIRHRRRANERRGEGFTASAWLALVAKFRNRCAYCGVEGPLHADHRVPLSRGGSNSIDNILPACAPCNMSKHDRTESEFLIRKYGASLDGTGPIITGWRVISPTVTAFELAADK